jgi:two-component system, cell cycle sensor histidine kinase DivJ
MRHHVHMLLKPAPAMAAAARLRLFGEGRLVAAALMLAMFPFMLAAHESPAVVASLVLATFLPAVVAMDCRRPGALDRAAMLGLVIAGATLSAGTLKGLPVAASLSLMAVFAIEAHMVVRRASRGRAALATIAAFACVGLASLFADHGHGAGAGGLAAAILAVTGGCLVIRALTSMLRSEITRARHERILSSEVESIVGETVVGIAVGGRVTRVGANAERVLGLPASALAGRGLVELTLVADRPTLLTACADALAFAAPRKTRFRLRQDVGDQSPRYRWVELVVQSSAMEGLVIGSLRDASADVAEEEMLKASAAEAEAARASRSAFLTTVNHELRTPLNAIIGFSDILSNPQTTPIDAERVRDYARIVNIAGQDLLRMVMAMLDITRLDSGVFDFQPEDADLRVLVSSAVDAFAPDGDARTEGFRCHLPDEALLARVDPRAFRSILAQLLSNAAKFGNGAGADITVSRDSSGILISVQDHGQGIAPEKLAEIGRQFVQLDERLDRTRAGMGLGLALARGLVALHGGRIGIESAPGKGTTVSLHIPAADTASPAADSDATIDGATNVLPLERMRRKPSAAATKAMRERKRA